MIEVKFSCSSCGLKDQVVEVPARESPDVEVRYYVEEVVGAEVGKMHRMLSPFCTSRKMDYVMIPLPDKNDPEPWIGKQTNGGPHG